MAKNDRDLDNVVLSLRLRGSDAVRFWGIMDAAKEKNAYAGVEWPFIDDDYSDVPL